MFEITVNGEKQRVPEGQSVARLLALLNLPQERVAVELNKEIIRKRDWDATIVGANSQVEVVEFVGGG
jgi:sulfur carrier protein